MAERKQLNLNAPLLSVRRFSSPIRPTEASKDDQEDSKLFHRRYSLPCLDQVTESVAVPFHWEQIPGRRKDDGGRGISSKFPVRWVPAIVKNHEDKKSTSEIVEVSKEGNDCDEDDDDDKFSDALESLSAMDSCSMKCSVSGSMSSSDCNGAFATDPQTRDFMMSRFLPAAKAMTLEQQPQYSAKNAVVAVEQQQSRHQVVVRRLESAAIVPYLEQQEEESDDECEETVNLPMKACGFFPRLCFKNSICLFSPVPGMKVKSLPSFCSSSSGKISKPSKAASSRSSSPSTRKSTKDDARQQRPSRGVQTPRTMEVENNKVVSGSDSLGDRQMSGRISPFSRRAAGGLSPYRNSAPQSPFQGTGGPRGLSKEAEMFKRNKPYLYCKGGSKSQELTPLYRTKQQAGPLVKNPSTMSLDNVAKTTTRLRSESSSSLERSSDSSDVIATGKELMVVPKTTNGNDDAGPGAHVCGESKALVCVSGNVDASLDSVSSGDSSSSLPPLLPKTPSESWLWRTLPAVSTSRSSPLGGSRASSFRGKWLDSKTSSATSKWETMVKSSYMHHDHVRYSEELVPHSSQHLTS